MKNKLFFTAVLCASLITGASAYAAAPTTTAAPSTIAAPTTTADPTMDGAYYSGALALPEPGGSMTSTAEPYGEAPSEGAPSQSADLIIPEHEPQGVQGRGEHNNLEYYYHHNGYPEFISYVYGYDKFMGEDGKMYIEYEIGLTDLSEENRNSVLETASEYCYISFAQDMFSHSYRTEVYEEMRKEFPEAYVSMANDCGRIYIYAPEGKEQEYLEKLGDRYFALVFLCDSSSGELLYSEGTAGVQPEGSAPVFDAGMGAPTTGAVTIPEKPDSSRTVLIITLSAAIAVAVTAGAVILIRRNRARISADGTATASAALTKNDVEQALRESMEQPSPETLDRILEKLQK